MTSMAEAPEKTWFGLPCRLCIGIGAGALAYVHVGCIVCLLIYGLETKSDLGVGDFAGMFSILAVAMGLAIGLVRRSRVVFQISKVLLRIVFYFSSVLLLLWVLVVMAVPPVKFTMWHSNFLSLMAVFLLVYSSSLGIRGTKDYKEQFTRRI